MMKTLKDGKEVVSAMRKPILDRNIDRNIDRNVR